MYCEEWNFADVRTCSCSEGGRTPLSRQGRRNRGSFGSSPERKGEYAARKELPCGVSSSDNCYRKAASFACDRGSA